MNKPKNRFLLYALIGLVFGVLDWFYLDWLAHLEWGSLGESVLVVPVIIAMNFGIWLVPLIPIVLYEAKQTLRLINPIAAGILTWSCAILSYYLFYWLLLSLGRLVHLEHLNVFGEKYPNFWSEYWGMFQRIILGQFIEWIIIALIGGAVLGALANWFVHRRKKARSGGEGGSG